jgi:hypothetical protein
VDRCITFSWDRFRAFVAIDKPEAKPLGLGQGLKERDFKNTVRHRAAALAKDVFDHLLRSAESYAEKSHYVRKNPVRAGLVIRWEDWPFRGEVFLLEYRSER